MHVSHPAAGVIRSLIKSPSAPKVAAAPAVVEAVILDSAAQAEAALAAEKIAAEANANVNENPEKILDDASHADKQKDEDSEEHILDNVGEYAATDIALKSAAAVQQWAETVKDDLADGEGLGDRLFALLVGIADDDMDGEISEDEAELLNLAAEQAVDYMVSKGVPEEDAIALLSDFDNQLADSVQELVITKLPDGDEAAAADIDAFVFGDGSDEAVLDATYKKRLVVRGGKKVRINKRVSGTIRLSAAQKLGVKKMLRRSHSAKAQVKRAKSMRVRKQVGL